MVTCISLACVICHRFPFKRPDILKLWITALQRENWYPSRTSRLCGHHFLETDYQLRPGCTFKLLKHDAVPSVFSFPKHFIKEIVECKTSIINTPEDVSSKVKIEPMDIDLNNTECQPSVSSRSTSTEVKILVNAETQTPTKDDSKLFLLQRKVKTLKQKLKRRDLKISNMKDLMNTTTKSGHGIENLDRALKHYFEGMPVELVLIQKKEDAQINPKQRRYSA